MLNTALMPLLNKGSRCSPVLSKVHAVNIEIMRAFVRLRAVLTSNKELARKLDALERRLGTHDQAIAGILSAIRELMSPMPPQPTKRRMGFVADE